MKTILKTIILTAVFAAATSSGFAISGTDAAASLRIEKLSTGYKKVVVELSGFSGPVSVTLTEEKGPALLVEHIGAGDAFAKVLDLSQLEAGLYTITVSSQLKETVQPLRITPADVFLLEEMRREYFAPVLRLQGRTLDLNWFNTRIANLDIEILEADGTEIFSDALRNVIRVERRYQLADLRRGSYTVRITTPHKTYYQTIQLK